METKRYLNVKLNVKKILIYILVTICFSNCTVFGYLYVQPQTWIAIGCMAILLLHKRYENIGIGIQLYLILLIGVLLSYIFSNYKSVVFPFLLIFVVTFLLYGVRFSTDDFFIFIKGCHYVSFFIAITILIEPFFNTFNVDYLWFLGTPYRFEIPALRENKLNEIAINAFSGVAYEKADAGYYMVIGISYLLSKFKIVGKLDKKDILSWIIYISALFLTGKRMLLICVVIIGLAMYALTTENNKILKIIAAVITVLLAMIILSNFVPAVSNMMQRFSNASSGEDGALAERYVKWSYALKLFKNNPFFGYGFASYNQAANEVGYLASYFVHNIYIELLCDTGLVGLICFFIYTVPNIYCTWKALIVYKYFKNSKEIFVLSFAFCMQLLILIYGLSGNTIFYRFQLFMYLFSILISDRTIKQIYKLSFYG